MGEPPGQPKPSIAYLEPARLAGSGEDPRSPSTSSGQAPRRGSIELLGVHFTIMDRERCEAAVGAASRLTS